MCLKNVHLVVAWLPVLEKALRGLTPHPSFRLLLTSEPHPAFPPSILEACLKVFSITWMLCMLPYIADEKALTAWHDSAKHTLDSWTRCLPVTWCHSLQPYMNGLKLDTNTALLFMSIH